MGLGDGLQIDYVGLLLNEQMACPPHSGHATLVPPSLEDR
jgi:hypothetical protein